MANVPADLLYTAEHEYVRTTSDPAVVEIGITDYAQGELGDIVFVDLPKPGAKFARMAVFGTVEAVKAVSELFCPLAGEVVEVNGALEGDPAADQPRPLRRRLDDPAPPRAIRPSSARCSTPAAYQAKIGG